MQPEGNWVTRAPTLARKAGEIPEIRSKASGLAEVFETAPHLAHQLVEIGDRLTRLLSPENEQRIASSLDNLHKMSADLAASARNVGETMALVKTTATHMDGLMGDIRTRADTVTGGVIGVLGKLQGMLDTLNNQTGTVMAEMVKTSAEARELSQSLRGLSDQTAAAIKENRVPVRDFTSVGLYELSLLISEMRDLTTSLSRVSGQIEKGPMEFLFTGSKPGLEKPK